MKTVYERASASMVRSLSLIGIALLSGCVTRMVDFTVISTKALSIGGEEGRQVVGEDCVPVVLAPVGTPNLKEAIDDAIEQAGPGYNAIKDGVVYWRNKSFFFGKSCYEVKGTPVKVSAPQAAGERSDQ